MHYTFPWDLGPGASGGHFLCRAVRDARLYMGYFWEIFCTFSARGTFFQQNVCIFSVRWVSILKKNSVFAQQDGTHLQEIFCILLHKVAEFYTSNFCIFLHDEYLFKRFTVVTGTVVVGTN